jgi:hypothetical protein
MSISDRDLEEQLTKHGEAHQAPYAWKEKVWRELAEPAAKPWKPGFAYWPLVGIATMVVLVGTGVFFQAQQAEKERAKKAEAALALRVDSFEKQVQMAQADVINAQADVDAAFSMLENAVDEKSRAEAERAGQRARETLKKKQAKLESIRVAGMEKSKRERKAKARKEKKLISKCAKSKDPLCGL